jgi:hypothetical protein
MNVETDKRRWKKIQNKGKKLIYCYGDLLIHLVMICDPLFSHSPTKFFDGLGDCLCYWAIGRVIEYVTGCVIERLDEL